MIIKLIAVLDDLIGTGATPATMREHLNSIREHAEALERETAALRQEMAELQPHRYQSQPPVAEIKATDPCPYCQKVSGILEDIILDKVYGRLGFKNGCYRCSNPNCGKAYEKRMPS